MKTKKETPLADYVFKAIGIDEFELGLTFEAKGHILALLMRQAHKAIKQKVGVMPKEHELEGLLDKHILPLEYNRLVHTFLKPVLKTIYDDVKKDKVIVLNDTPTRVMFYKKDAKWFIDILIIGTYHKN